MNDTTTSAKTVDTPLTKGWVAQQENLGGHPDPLQRQVGGSHYKYFRIQPIEFILGNNIPFVEGNIIKYACRWRQHVNPVESLEKIKHYCDILIDEHRRNSLKPSVQTSPQLAPVYSAQVGAGQAVPGEYETLEGVNRPL